MGFPPRHGCSSSSRMRQTTGHPGFVSFRCGEIRFTPEPPFLNRADVSSERWRCCWACGVSWALQDGRAAGGRVDRVPQACSPGPGAASSHTELRAFPDSRQPLPGGCCDSGLHAGGLQHQESILCQLWSPQVLEQGICGRALLSPEAWGAPACLFPLGALGGLPAQHSDPGLGRRMASQRCVTRLPLLTDTVCPWVGMASRLPGRCECRECCQLGSALPLERNWGWGCSQSSVSSVRLWTPGRPAGRCRKGTLLL